MNWFTMSTGDSSASGAVSHGTTRFAQSVTLNRCQQKLYLLHLRTHLGARGKNTVTHDSVVLRAVHVA